MALYVPRPSTSNNPFLVYLPLYVSFGSRNKTKYCSPRPQPVGLCYEDMMCSLWGRRWIVQYTEYGLRGSFWVWLVLLIWQYVVKWLSCMWQRNSVKESASMSLQRDIRSRKREILRKINNFLWWFICFEFWGMGNPWRLQMEASRRLR